MTQEEAIKLLPAIQAFARDGVVQYREHYNYTNWRDTSDPAWVNSREYREKPKSNIRPIRLDELPWPLWVKLPDRDNSIRQVIAIGSSNNLQLGAAYCYEIQTLISENALWAPTPISIDWKTFTVEETQ